MDIDTLFIMVNRAHYMLGYVPTNTIITDLARDFATSLHVAAFAVRLAQI